MINEENKAHQKKIKNESKNIVCSVSAVNYKEALLGYGIYWKDKKLLSTPGELLSYT